MNLTSDAGVQLDMITLGKAITCARDMPMVKKEDREKFAKLTLDKWEDEWQKHNKKEVVE